MPLVVSWQIKPVKIFSFLIPFFILVMRVILSFLVLFLFVNISAQNKKRLKLKKYKVAELHQSLNEISGMTFLKGKLYALNDGGNPSTLFSINPKNGEIEQSWELPFENFDWEALTSDEENFYIADIGNNWGTRRDLTIYKIKLDSISDFKTIKYEYPEQTDFSKKPHSNNYDAESIVFENGKLHLFTKEWNTYQTSHYEIDTASEGKQSAKLLEEYPLGYLATDATFFENKLYIVGYTKNMRVFLSIFEKDDKGLFFSNKPKKYFLGMAYKIGQIEGVTATSEGIYISNEAFNLKLVKVPQRLYFIPKEKL